MYSLTREERIFYPGFGALTLLIASLPYLFGIWATPPGHVYTGLISNIDDVAVYLSWMRQAASGEFFQRNLFNTGPQQGTLFSVFSLLLGGLMKLTALSPPAVYHLARVLFGGLFLWAVVILLKNTVAETLARRLAFALVCVGSGFGWLFGGRDPAKGYAQPIDVWQPEAIPFLSLYYAPLFCAGLALMVVFVVAAVRFERSGRLTDIIPAALSGALLANFHTYDVVHLFAVWIMYRAVADIRERRFQSRSWLGLIVAGLVTLPSLAYTYYALVQDPLFKARDVKTLTGSPVWILLGFGLPFLLAVFGILRPDSTRLPDTLTRLWLTVWMVVGIAVAYLPVDFQRKMLMGTFLPISVLGGVTLAGLASRLSGDFPKIVMTFGVGITAISNLLFLQADMDRLRNNIGWTEHRPYLTRAEAEALTWLREHAGKQDGVLVSPDPASHRRFPFFPLRPYLSVFIPAYAGRPVYNGHWSETADFGGKWTRANLFFRADTTEEYRQELLNVNAIRYVLYANALAEGPPQSPDGTPLSDDRGIYLPVDWINQSPPSFLRAVYQNSETTIFQVQLP